MRTSFKKILLSGVAWRSFFYATTFLLNLSIAHTLGAAESGSFFYILNNLSIIILLLNFGFESAITYAHSKKEFSYSYLFFLAVLWSFFSTTIFTVIYYFTSKFGIVQFEHLSYYFIFYILCILLTS